MTQPIASCALSSLLSGSLEQYVAYGLTLRVADYLLDIGELLRRTANIIASFASDPSRHLSSHIRRQIDFSSIARAAVV